MELREALLVVARFAHTAAAALLIGGSAWRLLAADDAEAGTSADGRAMSPTERASLKDLVDLTLLVFLVTGGLLTFERLSTGAATTSYVLLLGLKLLLSLLLYRWAFQLRREAGWNAGLERKLVGSGLVILLLAAVLKTIYESGLRT
jgi:hypothetical protein